jgi:endoglucanase
MRRGFAGPCAHRFAGRLGLAFALPLVLAALPGSAMAAIVRTEPAPGADAPAPVAASAAAASSAPAIALNQIGFLPSASKRATVPAGTASRFAVVDLGTGRVALTGPLGPAAMWPPAGLAVRTADFSAITTPGRYVLRVAGLADSAPFRIADGAYDALTAAAIRAFYFNRSGIALTPALADVHARAAGHPDTRVLIHASAAGPKRRAGDVIASPKGWYDAGDYNKYIVNSGISVYTLLAAYEQAPARWRALRVGLPESGNGLPDLLNEALWNIDWMLTMQDPDDGGVYHKLTSPRFDGSVMPDVASATGTRVVVQKSTAAALDFAAVMAVGSRVFRDFEAQRPGLSARMLKAARSAWDWARAHPDAIYRQPPDIHTGEYGDDTLDDEFAWAAAELYITTREDAFLTALRPARTAMTVPSWNDVRGLAWMSLATHRHDLTPAADPALIERRVLALADQLLAKSARSSWGVALAVPDFGWGSNGTVLNEAMVLLQADRLAPGADRPYRRAAQDLLDYVLGRNPLGMSMVTGFGAHSPRHPHHRPSEAGRAGAPVPGFVVGGANAGRQDVAGCPVRYPSTLPALSYLDHFCSYASNEVAINWNAPLVYVAGALGEE